MNFIQQWQYNKFIKKDLWREARQRHKPNLVQRFPEIIQSFRGRPAYTMSSIMTALARQNVAMMIDLSSYEKGAKLKPFYEAGAKYFCFRMFYQAQYMTDHFDNTEDPCYKSWFEEAAELGKDVRIGGYGLYCAGVDAQDYEHSEILLTMADQVMGSYYHPHFYFWDDEVNKWWENNRQTTATDVNQVKGIRILTDKSYKRLKNYYGEPMITGHYSGLWFMLQTAGYKREYTTWLDNAARAGTTIPNWHGYYITLNPGSYANLGEFINNNVPIPTSTQEQTYLDIGNELWDMWQCAGDIQTPWGKADISFSRLPAAQFDAMFNLKPVDTTPTPPPPGGDTPPDLTAVLQRLDSAEARLAALENQKYTVTVTR